MTTKYYTKDELKKILKEGSIYIDSVYVHTSEKFLNSIIKEEYEDGVDFIYDLLKKYKKDRRGHILFNPINEYIEAIEHLLYRVGYYGSDKFMYYIMNKEKFIYGITRDIYRIITGAHVAKNEKRKKELYKIFQPNDS